MVLIILRVISKVPESMVWDKGIFHPRAIIILNRLRNSLLELELLLVFHPKLQLELKNRLPSLQ
jgi:hypothetical protein